VEAVIFYILAGCLLVLGLVVITRTNPIASALALVGVFGVLSALYALLAAPLLAVLQILVYAGGIMVLVVFVIMLLNLHPEELKPMGAKPGAVVLFVLLALAGFGVPLSLRFLPLRGAAIPALPEGFGGIQAVATLLFGPTLLAFEVLSLVLLAAVVGALVLAKRRL